ncbi:MULTISPECIES: hypothetical protein [Bifidobacterium]|jgi:hypothetical protein|uniref:hypothetical protein n=1 Tax=Bifidobacterium TaxID=1678 RepID=UPI002355C2E2|nr:hypothetical protein [Bifidobacterium tibiigranuli]MCI1211637.1 hypothetical protein [Bifidobacterium tibiigranuli]MCI1221113.1 hypothetical protein [Bifidobacterium tibiigranuli]
MKNELVYQSTDYTCAPATMVNALRYLFDRDEIRPDVLWSVFRASLDMYGSDGSFGGDGTSPDAMLSLVSTFNMYGESGRFPIRARLLHGEDALAGESSESGKLGTPLRRAIASGLDGIDANQPTRAQRNGEAVHMVSPGAVGVARVWSNRMNGHYVLVTGFGALPDGAAAVRVFDPYKDSKVDGVQVQRIEHEPAQANRLIAASLFDSGERVPYALVNDRYERRVIVIERRESA